MTTAAQLREQRILEIERILASGAQSVTVDGESVSYDLASLRRELNKLKAQDDPGKKPVLATINLGGFQG